MKTRRLGLRLDAGKEFPESLLAGCSWLVKASLVKSFGHVECDAYGFGMTAVVWFEYPLSFELASTAVAT